MHDGHPFHHIEDYEPLVGSDTIERVREKARPLQGVHVAHVNSTFYGGGVAELLSSLTLLMSSVGIRTGWRAIHGPPDFFSITKKMHNALQGAEIHLTDLKTEIYEDVIYENALRNRLDHDFVVVHDPQPLPLIEHYRKRGPWIWRCHIDIEHPHGDLWNYLAQYVDQYDAVILTLQEYAQRLKPPQVFFMPAIDPFTIKNSAMSEAEVDERLKHYHIPTDLPLVVQISRFDEWKDPQGVIEAFQIARREVDATLVLLGNVATDDPEGETVFKSLLDCREERIHVLSVQDSALVNALQRAGRRGPAEVAPRGFWTDRGRGHVEEHPGHRRQRRRHPLPDRRQRQRLPRRFGAPGRRAHRGIAQRQEAAKPHGARRPRNRGRKISADPPAGTVPRPVQQFRNRLPAKILAAGNQLTQSDRARFECVDDFLHRLCLDIPVVRSDAVKIRRPCGFVGLLAVFQQHRDWDVADRMASPAGEIDGPTDQ